MLVKDRNELANLTESGTPPKTRLGSADACRQMYLKAKEHNSKREWRNSQVKGLVDGNPPYSAAKLKSTGQSYRANFNNGEAESFLNTAITAFYDIFSEVDHRANVEVPGELPDAPKLSDFATEQFDWLIDQHDSLDYLIQLSLHDMVLYGRGPQVWEDALDWRSKAIHHDDLILPQNAKSNVTDWEKCWIKADYRVDELYRFISDPKAAADAGWNVEEVKKAIIHACEPAYPEGGKDWQRTQQWIRNNDTYAGEMALVVRCARMLYKEFPKDGEEAKISEAWVWLDGSDSDFLFQALDQYDDWRQAINPLFYDRGDGSAHSVRGLGVKMFAMLQAKQRLQNATVDAAMVRSALVLKALGSGAAAQQLAVAPVGPFMVLPNAFEVVSLTNTTAIDAPLAVARDLDNTLASNLGQYRARLEKPEGNPRTAFEVNAELQKQSILGKTQIARYYQQLDEFWAETFRRACSDRIPSTTKNKWLKLALEFQERCSQRGIPLNILRKCRVTARRTVGQGSAYMRALQLGNLFSQLYGALPEDGKVNLVNDMIAANAGRESVSRYNPGPEIRKGEARQRWEAQVENDTLRNRGQVTVTPEHNDVIHLQEHLAFSSQAAASLEQGADPMDIYGILQAEGQHMALHLQRLATNPLRQEEFKLLNDQFQQLSRLVDQLEGQLKQIQEQKAEQAAMAQKAQAVAAGTDPETALKTAEVMHKMELKEKEKMAGIAIKAKQQAAKEQLDIQRLQHERAIKDAQTATDIAATAAKTASAVKAQQMKAKTKPTNAS